MSSYQENIGSTQALVSALNAMEEKNARLENSLSAETRLKLDLFSALGEAKRQLEIAQSKFYVCYHYSQLLLHYSLISVYFFIILRICIFKCLFFPDAC